MAEAQAIDRIHRIGQLRQVVATRYITRNSIETVCSQFSLLADYQIKTN